MKKTISCVIFDLDGTLLNTMGTISETMNRILVKEGLPPRSQDKLARLVGWGAEKFVKDLFSDDFDQEGLLELYKNNLKENSLEGTVLYDGMGDLLDYLTEHKLPLAILTNKPQDTAEKVCRHYLGDWHFDTIRGLEEGVVAKPDNTEAMKIITSWKIKPCECLYLGDTALDMETARNSGFLAVGCTWGFRERKELEESGADIIVDHPSEVKNFVKVI